MNHRSASHSRPGPQRPFGDVVVAAHDLRRVYGSGGAQVHALDGVSLAVPRGQFAAVMGPSGSGKSTLLHCLAGLDTPTSGRVLIAGQDLAGMKDKELTAVRRDRLGFIFQAFNLLPNLTAQENIELPSRLAHRKIDADWLAAIIETLGIGDRLTHKPTELSGGQQQRVAVARALATRPEVIFADEPTGALDSTSAALLLDTLGRLCSELGQTVVMVTHDESAAAATNRIIRLRDGRIISDAAPVPTGAATAAAPAPRGGAPAPQGTAPVPQGGAPAPAPRTGTPMPQGGIAPVPQGGAPAPAPRTGTPMPQGGAAPAPQGGAAPAPQGGAAPAPGPWTGAPAPQTSITPDLSHRKETR